MRIRGIVHISQLGTHGIGDAARRRFLRRGLMERVGSWYVRDVAPPEVVALLRQGVRPTCVSAARLHGLWTPLHEGEHVYRPRGPVSPETSSSLVMHGSDLRSWPDRSPVAGLELTLTHAARCLPVRDAAILFESALNKRLITMVAAQRIIAGLPRARRAQLSRVSPLAESGTETAVRWWLESLHVPVAPQVRVPGVGRVDLRLGESWVIECDSVQFHDNPRQYHLDRARDLQLQAHRYTVTRLTWEQVFLDWDRTSAHLRTILRRREHRRPLAS
jgi:very-short-patch-repair endonuclease